MSVPGSPSATRQPDGIARKNTSALIQPDDFESLFTNTELRQQLGTLAYPANATSVSVVPRQTRYQTAPVVRKTRNKWYLDGAPKASAAATSLPRYFEPQNHDFEAQAFP